MPEAEGLCTLCDLNDIESTQPSFLIRCQLYLDMEIDTHHHKACKVQRQTNASPTPGR